VFIGDAVMASRPPPLYRHAFCGGVLGPNTEGFRVCQACGAVLDIGLALPQGRGGLDPDVLVSLIRVIQGWS
jgi:hypothetical protein